VENCSGGGAEILDGLAGPTHAARMEMERKLIDGEIKQ
jgi:hypothetical protein